MTSLAVAFLARKQIVLRATVSQALLHEGQREKPPDSIQATPIGMRMAARRHAAASVTSLLACVLLCAQADAAASDAVSTWVPNNGSLQVQSAPEFRANVAVTTIPVVVLDDDGLPVPGLGRDDFVVAEEGVRQAIAFVLAPDDAPLDVALVLDFSDSIRSRAPNIKQHAKSFIRSLSATDCLYLIPFASRARPVYAGRADEPMFGEIIDRAELAGATAFYDAVLLGLSALQDSSASSLFEFLAIPGLAGRVHTENTASQLDWQGSEKLPAPRADCGRVPGQIERVGEVARRRKALVVLTDGADGNSVFTFPDLLFAAWRTDVPIFPVGIGTAGVVPIALRALEARGYRSRVAMRSRQLAERLEELARITGGRLTQSRGAMLGDAFDDIVTMLRGSYVVAYHTSEPKVTTSEPTWRAVDVQVRDSEWQVYAPDGYYQSASDFEYVRASLASAREHARQEDSGEALADIERAVAADPTSWELHYLRALFLAHLGRWSEAIDAVADAAVHNPGEPRIHGLAFQGSYELHEYEKAWEHGIRAHQAGADMSAAFSLLSEQAPPPPDLDDRLNAPRIFVVEQDLGELERQAAYRRILRVLRRAVSESRGLALVVRRQSPDYLLVLQVDGRFVGGTPREIKASLELYVAGARGERRLKLDLELSGSADEAALQREFEAHLSEVEDRIRDDRHERSQRRED